MPFFDATPTYRTAMRLNRDVPSPRCQRVLPGQHLRIVNKTCAGYFRHPRGA